MELLVKDLLLGKMYQFVFSAGDSILTRFQVLTAFGLLQFDLYKVRGSVWRFTHPDGRYVNGKPLLF